ncbi:MAG TPA: hypothetical protein VMN35_01320 [Gaiellaceae bacterium]|nr:hypothetical protein [Gaiellaceae bacterium]
METTTYEFTRPEIAEYLRETFERPGLVQRGDVVKALSDKDAPQEMIDLVVARIPEGAWLTDMRGLWIYLREVPLERERS